jgi:hypothetical protein
VAGKLHLLLVLYSSSAEIYAKGVRSLPTEPFLASEPELVLESASILSYDEYPDSIHTSLCDHSYECGIDALRNRATRVITGSQPTRVCHFPGGITVWRSIYALTDTLVLIVASLDCCDMNNGHDVYLQSPSMFPDCITES